MRHQVMADRVEAGTFNRSVFIFPRSPTVSSAQTPRLLPSEETSYPRPLLRRPPLLSRCRTGTEPEVGDWTLGGNRRPFVTGWGKAGGDVPGTWTGVFLTPSLSFAR